MTAREVLDGIRGRLTAADAHDGAAWSALPALTDDSVIMHRVYDDEGLPIAECGSPGVASLCAAAPTDVARLLALAEAVLGLHTPDTYGECTICRNRAGHYHRYPCPTVAAVEAALKEDPQ